MVVSFQIYHDCYSAFKPSKNSTILTREIWHTRWSCPQSYISTVQPKLPEAKDLYSGILMLLLAFQPKPKKSTSLNLNLPIYATKESFPPICFTRNLWNPKLEWNLIAGLVCILLLHNLIFGCSGRLLWKIIFQTEILLLESLCVKHCLLKTTTFITKYPSFGMTSQITFCVWTKST